MRPLEPVDWHGDARELVRRAAQIEVSVPPAAQARVWKAVEKRRARAVWRVAFPMFLAGAASAALVLLMMNQPPKDSPEAALVLLADGTQQRLSSGSELPRSPALSLIDLRDAGRMVAGAETRARLERFENGVVELFLDEGSLLLQVNPRTRGEPFVVRAPGLTARVVGTVLRVAVAHGRSSVSVGHGTVEVTVAGGAPILVRDGEHWPAQPIDPPSAAELQKLGVANFTTTESALYTAGWQKLKVRDLRGALAAWREQIQKYPHGLLRREAQASIIDALVALHEDAQARTEVDAYLHDHPEGLRSAEMHFVRGTLLYAADHDCRRAAAEFNRALLRPAEPWAHKARAARAACKP